MTVTDDVDPLFDVFNDNEERLAAMIRGDGQKAVDLRAVGAAIAAGFLLYTLYMKRRLREEIAARDRPVTPHTLYELNSKIFVDGWARIAWTLLPAITQGYYLGLRDVSQGNYSRGWIQNAAEEYATSLAEHLHDTSSEALVQGVQAQINRRVTQRKVIDNVIEAFGAPPRTMNALVNVWSAEPERMLSTGEGRDTLKTRADSMVAKAIAERAANIGQTESHAVKNNAKSIVWLYLQQEGQLPKDATKMWITAKDERVCPVCGPLHKVQVPLDAKFQTAQGEVWAPSLHPRCRCDIVLRGAVQVFDSGEYLEESAPRELELAKSAWGVVSKARGSDKFDRDRSGQFAAQESRPVPKTKTAEYEVDERVARLMESISTPERASQLTTFLAEHPVQETKLTAGPKLSGGSKLSTTRLTGATKLTGGSVTQDRKLSKPRLARPTLSSAQLSAVKLRNAAAAARLEQHVPKFSTERATAMETPTFTESETWRNTPDNKPMYGIFDPHVNDVSHDMLWADHEVEWYTAGESGLGVPSMEQGVNNYWKKILDPHNLRQEFHNETRDFAMIEDEDHGDYLVVPSTSGEMYVPFDIYEQAWKASVYGLTQEEAPDVVVQQASYSENEYGDYEYDEEDVVPISLFQLSKMLDLPDRVHNLRPIVAKTNQISDESDGYWGGIMSNPGKWRIHKREYRNADRWGGRAPTEPWPFQVVSVEPEDR